MIRRPPRSTLDRSSAASDVYKRQLVRRRKRWLVYPAMLGGAALLADGIITPPISITSAIEGLRELPAMRNLGQADNTIVLIVLSILAAFFFLQQFGTASIAVSYTHL